MKPRITLFFSPGYVMRIEPKGIAPPLSLAYVAQILQNASYEVTSINSNEHIELNEDIGTPAFERKTLQKLLAVVEKTNPDILYISSWTYAMPFTAEFCKAFRQKYPDIPIILAGANASNLPQETLELIPELTAVVKGEGQFAMLDVVKAIEARKKFEQIQGISFRNNGNIIHNFPYPRIKNLDELPLLDFSSFENKNMKHFYFLTSYGCPSFCGFCSEPTNWPGWRGFSIPYVMKQLKLWEKVFGNIQVNFYDADFTWNKERVLQFCKAMKENNFDFPWFCYSRVDNLDEEMMKVMKEAGNRYIFFGIESLHPKTLQWYSKAKDIPAYLKSIPKAISLVNQHNIKATLSFIAGCPIETKQEMEEHYEQMVNLARSCTALDHVELSRLTLEINSRFYHMWKRNALALKKIKNENLSISYSGYQLFTKQYEDYVWMTPQRYVFENQHIPQEELEELMIGMARK
ncbi:B12-binding domain-containing radical SAM protein, partial [Candidatus Woesearchaeota archaeon]|nr:B12-binding domain-containing radical SAM protein [Candidatus Woesearchaeota archaeon]